MTQTTDGIIVTAGSNYLDIDAYACCAAMAELLTLQGKRAAAVSAAVPNYSVCRFLTEEGQVLTAFPAAISAENAQYIIVDVSDPDYIKEAAPLDRVTAVYDHHVGFESYWEQRIGEGAHIEFIGAAATLIFREWKTAGLLDRMRRSTARLLIAAILDNTLNLISTNTTDEDREAYETLCRLAGEGDAFRAAYFSEVQANVEADLENALKNDLKHIGDDPVLPADVAQLCVWDARGVLERLDEIRTWLGGKAGGFMLNLIDMQHRCCYFVCDDPDRQQAIERVFDVRFEAGTARTAQPYLRKQIIKKVLDSVR